MGQLSLRHNFVPKHLWRCPGSKGQEFDSSGLASQYTSNNHSVVFLPGALKQKPSKIMLQQPKRDIKHHKTKQNPSGSCYQTAQAVLDGVDIGPGDRGHLGVAIVPTWQKLNISHRVASLLVKVKTKILTNYR